MNHLDNKSKWLPECNNIIMTFGTAHSERLKLTRPYRKKSTFSSCNYA